MNGVLIGKLVAVFFMATVKFLVSPFMAAGLGLDFVESMASTIVGGLSGICFFYYGSAGIMSWVRKRKMENNSNSKKKKAFKSKSKRRFIQIKQRYGLPGIAILTPVILSIPVGCILAARYFRHDKRMFPALLAAVLSWALILNGLIQWTGLLTFLP